MSIRIDLPELNEGQFVEIKDPKFIPWGAQKELTSLVTSKAEGAQFEVAEKLALVLIKNGNIVNEDGVPFVFPLTTETVKDVPAIVVQRVTEKFSELKGFNPDRKN